MDGDATTPTDTAAYPVRIHIAPATENRNRLTTAFRLILAIPHLLLVGGPLAAMFSWSWTSEAAGGFEWGTIGGVLGAVAAVIAVIAWFGILITGRFPVGLWNLAAFYCDGVFAQWRTPPS